MGNSILLSKLESQKAGSSLLDGETPVARPLNSDAQKPAAAAPAEKKAEYKELLRQIRIQLMADGVYDRKMLKLMLKLRCKDNPAHHECVEKLEG